MTRTTETAARAEDAAEPGGRLRSLWRGWVRPLLVVALLVGSTRSAVANWYHVPTGSMKPTIVEGDRILVNRLAYDVRVPFLGVGVPRADPRRGDVVVLRSPVDGTLLVKRVVGVPGDRVELVGHRLWVNGAAAGYGPLDPEVVGQVGAADRTGHRFAAEDLGGRVHPVMVSPGGGDLFGPVTVPAGHYLVMGDNRDHSLDSRAFGFVPRDRVEGRVVGVAVSLDPDRGYRPRWGRFLRATD